MKTLSLVSIFALLFINASCGSRTKYDKAYMDVQRQEAHDMIDRSEKIKIKRGMGDDKIILEDL